MDRQQPSSLRRHKHLGSRHGFIINNSRRYLFDKSVSRSLMKLMSHVLVYSMLRTVYSIPMEHHVAASFCCIILLHNHAVANTRDA